MGAWFVPLGPVLDGHGLAAIKPYAFATSAIAAFISPLIFGAMADRHFAPVVVLRWLAFATATAMVLAGVAIENNASPWIILACIQLHALCNAPTWGISSAIVLKRLSDPQRQFGPVRSLGSIGWMVGCWVVSGLHADTSTVACYAAAGIWLMVVALTYWLPRVAPPPSSGSLTISERLGWDALVLLRNPDHRVVFLTLALFSIPLAAFYPYTPTQMQHLGLDRTSAWMTLGQTTEIVAMLGLAAVMGRFRLKWIFAAGLAIGVLRYVLCAMDTRLAVLTGVMLHGFSFTLVFITGQIYLDQRIDPAWRVRAQALFSVMTSGFGNLIGYLSVGWWFWSSHQAGEPDWPQFWGVLAAAIGAVTVFFLAAYRGAGAKPKAELA